MPNELTSLEIVNKDLQDFEKALEDYKKRKEILNEEVDEEYIKQITKEIERYKQIKQDLEVLEIIKNRIKCKVNMGSHGFKNSHKHISFILYNYIEEQKKDFNKVKQWLGKEGNK